MRTAIVGSRDFTNYEHLVECLASHPVPITSVVSGGARGTDTLAERYARENNLPLTVFKPEYEKYGRSAPLKRNTTIVENSEQVIAFPKPGGRGTQHTIREARRIGVAVFVFYPIFT